MFKFIRFFIVVNLIYLDILFATKLNLTINEQEYLQNKKIIKMCVDPNWMPFEKIQNNKHIGIASDYMKIISSKLGVPIQFVNTNTWMESVQKAQDRKCDIYSIVSITPKRAEYMDFTTSYVKTPIVIATRNDEPLLKNIFQKALDSITVEQKRSIFNKWVLIDSKNKTNYILIGKIIAIFIVILLVVLYFLIKQNRLKTKIEELNSNLQDKINEAMIDLIEAKKLAKMGIWSFDIQKQKLIWCDETYKIFEMVRRKDRELKIKDYLSSIHLDEAFFISNKYNKHLENQKEFNEIHKIITHNNIRKWVEIKCITSYDKKGIPLISKGTIQDITEKKLKDIQIQEKNKQMLHQSRLAQMGEMISMIAHQWRQPLNAISLTSSNLQLKCMTNQIDNKLFLKELKHIDRYSEHLSKTIDDFRGFFKDNKDKSKVSLMQIINDTLDIVLVSLENKNIKIVKNITCNLDIEIYQNELKQVVLNLIKNAEDVLLENNIKNPTITIEVLCNKLCQGQTLIIKDNGGGISKEIIAKIFEPYFSTKKSKDGTGLGLYMSKIIVEDHCNGKLSVENDRDGAVFKIEFFDEKSVLDDKK